MISRWKRVNELKNIDRQVRLSPKEFKPFWEYYRKGFDCCYHGASYEERNLHSMRLGWIISTDYTERMKGAGYYCGFSAGKNLETTGRGRKPIGISLPHLSVPDDIAQNLQLIADHYRVPVNEVRRSAYIWYCEKVCRELGVDSFIENRSKAAKSYFYDLLQEKGL